MDKFSDFVCPKCEVIVDAKDSAYIAKDGKQCVYCEAEANPETAATVKLNDQAIIYGFLFKWMVENGINPDIGRGDCSNEYWLTKAIQNHYEQDRETKR